MIGLLSVPGDSLRAAGPEHSGRAAHRDPSEKRRAGMCAIRRMM